GMLINILKELKKNGNTIVVIEHDKEMISHADLVIDLGLYGGEKGGTIIYAGTVNGLKRCKPSFTGKYLRGEEKIFLHKRYLTQEKKQQHRKKTEKKSIVIHGAGEHNLKNVNVLIPLNRLVVVTGVSGSGKSTLLYDVLFNNFLRFRGRPVHSLGKVNSIEGLEHVADIVLINQTSIGRTPRSNPVTFINAFDAIRNVFAKTKSSRLRKMRSRHFSFNVEGGRCETCKGSGKIKVEMHFLADIYIECEACRGTRYKKEVLEVTHKGKNIHDVLNMTIDDALVFFEEVHVLLPKLQILRDIGLGYLKLGQPATTLSGGEAQRLKLAAQLLEKGQRNVLFLFDEPTVGLHYHDISYLMKALERLLERGNSVVMIEHNLEVIKCADYIIDLGPEGGESGGELIFSGLPQKLVKEKRSYTCRFLKDYI
ncbi:MAG: excinuclease ABC subunit A, partial [Candidatus Omnitrophica bacterium]|nr:excinuclease ABC subunit A [Candidatus Omnitrophota bacterium]